MNTLPVWQRGAVCTTAGLVLLVMDHYRPFVVFGVVPGFVFALLAIVLGVGLFFSAPPWKKR